MTPGDRRAAQALPTLDDLWGPGWVTDRTPTGSAASTSPALADAGLPDEFPDAHVDGAAEVTYRRGLAGLLVHALAVVFDDDGAAARAWRQLAAPSFTEGFAGALADDVGAQPSGRDTELLGPALTAGPVLPPGAHPDLRLAGHRALFSAAAAPAGEAGSRPIVLDVAVVGIADLVVLVWCASPGTGSVATGWPRLVTRTQRRAVALAGGAG